MNKEKRGASFHRGLPGQARPHRATLITTHVPALPFDFVDFEVSIAEKPRKFYRVRQP